MAHNPYEIKKVPFGSASHEARPEQTARTVVEVADPSIGRAIGIEAGDEIVEVNGKKIQDVFDYRLAILESDLLLTVRKATGEIETLKVVKDEYEDLGLEFAEAMMDNPLHCHNQCQFCFIDQLPPGMRETLYFKDDDMRLSFLSGNYITLTNMKDEELDRLIAYHLSPMNVSVHTTNPDLRKKMLGNRFADKIMSQLKKIAAHGIEINVQIVLMPGVNDGQELERTLADLRTLGENLQSIAIVPVGLTKYREERGLTKISPVDQSCAQAVLEFTAKWQKSFLDLWGRRVLYPADEFYLLAGDPIPDAEAYEDFPQLENGIGMLSLYRQEMTDLIQARKEEIRTGAAGEKIPEQEPERIDFYMPVGRAAADFMRPFCEELGNLYGAGVHVILVENEFFGPSITVSGLLTGQDLAKGLQKAIETADPGQKKVILIGDVMLRQGEEIFLDDWTVTDLENRLGLPVRVVSADAQGLAEILKNQKEFRK